MTTVLICDCFGGWGLSREALHRLREMGNQHALDETDIGELYPDSATVRASFGGMDSFLREIPRDDPDLLQVFAEMGQDAAGRFCHIRAVEVPDGIDWVIDEYDGNETVEEAHRSWR